MARIDKAEIDRRTESEVGGPDVTTGGYGRLVPPKPSDGYELHDADNDRRVDSDASLKSLLQRSGQYTTMDVDRPD